MMPECRGDGALTGSLGLTSPLQKWQKNLCAARAAPEPVPAAEASAIFLFRRGGPRGQAASPSPGHCLLPVPPLPLPPCSPPLRSPVSHVSRPGPKRRRRRSRPQSLPPAPNRHKTESPPAAPPTVPRQSSSLPARGKKERPRKPPKFWGRVAYTFLFSGSSSLSVLRGTAKGSPSTPAARGSRASWWGGTWRR